MKLKPIGSKLLIEPKEKENFKTEGGIEIVQNELSEGTIIEVSEGFESLYKVGDTILYNADAGKPQPYNGKQCQWIDGRAISGGGDVWAVILKSEK